MQAFGRFLTDLNWNVLSYRPSCRNMCDLFYDIIFMGLYTILPRKSVELHGRDKARGLLLQSNSSSPKDRRLLRWETQSNTTNYETM